MLSSSFLYLYAIHSVQLVWSKMNIFIYICLEHTKKSFELGKSKQDFYVYIQKRAIWYPCEMEMSVYLDLSVLGVSAATADLQLPNGGRLHLSSKRNIEYFWSISVQFGRWNNLKQPKWGNLLALGKECKPRPIGHFVHRILACPKVSEEPWWIVSIFDIETIVYICNSAHRTLLNRTKVKHKQKLMRRCSSLPKKTCVLVHRNSAIAWRYKVQVNRKLAQKTKKKKKLSLNE